MKDKSENSHVSMNQIPSLGVGSWELGFPLPSSFIIHPSESGQALAELAIVLLLLVIFMGGVMMIGPLVYTHVAVQTAANDCATAAAQTLNAAQGQYQGIAAALESLSSFRIRPSAARVSVAGAWTRGSPVTCTVNYNANLNWVPAIELFNPPTNVQYSVSLPAQRFKSIWR